ncbi:unnamed protein product [Phyllotreta striolata]|uniref:Zinc finger CCCH domain-containing protein 3 n=1 Tax=Phyllotreta striolata TaxID=444603 RepID=A0A9P0GXU4_PHYSR|nr:unnamed protein product [Phyllotreta striolata]
MIIPTFSFAVNPPVENGHTNKYVYFKQNFVQHQSVNAPKVLVNPHFNKTVFVNPNYIPNDRASGTRKIHINPNKPISFPLKNTANNIHINPNVLRNIPIAKNAENAAPQPKKNLLTYASKTKLIRTPLKEFSTYSSRQAKARRVPVYSQYKIVKIPKSNKKPSPAKVKSRFKLDNRSTSKNVKYVFSNRFLSITDIAKNMPLKVNRNLVNISGVFYKKSPMRLQKIVKKDKTKLNATLKKSRYKIIRNNASKKKVVNKKKTSRGSMRKCNIPCPFYRKFGKCKGKDMGKCHRKHDPDQIALCTKFLQGACVDTKCLLSHNVSAEKMPTCKFYLEGSCSKDNCPYLHVRINPKADICRDFIEGFCKKASQCDKRHQFLCPDFEKKGSCSKTRCPYPHGRMVRKYSDYNKHEFAKKSSEIPADSNRRIDDAKSEESNPPARYYNDRNSAPSDGNRRIDCRIRPKLGVLPSFISLEET